MPSAPLPDSNGPAAASPAYDNWRDIITADVRETYRKDGVVLLRQALHPEWLRLIEMGIRRRLATPDTALFYKGEAGEFKETIRNFDVIPEIQRLLYDSPIADMMSMLFGCEKIYYYSDEFFIKEGYSRRTPWHQDIPYFPLEGEQIASMWLSVDPLKREECLESIPGSHRATRYDGFTPGDESHDPTKGYYGRDLPQLPDIEAEREKWNIVAWDMQPGDVILLHPGVLHGGGPMSEGGRRRTITIRCYGEDIVYAERPPSRPTAPMTPGLSLRLKPGDPLRHPWYPRLRPLPAHQIVT
jgi:ectoine hydroxylase-related dioxygenase (phytanoyl-CoA dioxygenase family)